jgi:hypothetical protein
LRVEVPTEKVGDVIGKVRGRSWKVERNVEGQKEFGGRRMDGRMEVALKAKRLSPGRRLANFRGQHLRCRAFCTGFAFSFLGS